MAAMIGVGLAGLTLDARDAAAWNSSRTSTGAAVRWFARFEPLPFHLAAVRPEEMSPEIVAAVIETAWDTWQHAGCDDVPTARFAGATEDLAVTPPKTLRAPPDNLVVFVRTAGEWDALGRGGAEIAVTFVASNDKTGEIIDADIVVNDARWVFTTGGGSVPGEVDFVSAMTHEVGHALGLEHSEDARATMFATYTSADPLGARTLDDDDREGLCALYAGVPDHLSGRKVDGCGGASGAAAGLLGCAAAVAVWRRARAHGRMPRT